MRFWCQEPSRSVRLFDWTGERFSAHSFGDDRPPLARSRSIPLGRLVPLPTPPPDLLISWSPIVEAPVSDFKTRPHNVRTPTKPSPTPTATELRRAVRHADKIRRQAEECAKWPRCPSSMPTPPASTWATPATRSASSPPPTIPTPSASSLPTRPDGDSGEDQGKSCKGAETVGGA